MPKLKSHSGAKKRFKKTATGKMMYKKPGLRHLIAPVSGSYGRKKRKPGILNSTDTAKLSRMLPYS
ncbi:MAG: 50S ribosomal protein L35 [Elusimicrobia bacterium CG1_02_63_36]|nr:MAG: 50S ribosomal protein L35 [Elusimicrobia bacterium CG1_02_63_36]PJA16123.1 MAG: 50S ribosomal protein L35 [Elusimicrobia bacterium CG_4_10_14_0_2_um_filter_63_34]